MAPIKTKKNSTNSRAAVSPSRQKNGTGNVRQAIPTLANYASNQIITTESIASRAYTLWEQAGCPQGCDLDHWLQAESQLKQRFHKRFA